MASLLGIGGLAHAQEPPADFPVEVRLDTGGEETRLLCGDGQRLVFFGSHSLHFDNIVTCRVEIGGWLGVFQVSDGSRDTITCRPTTGVVTCGDPDPFLDLLRRPRGVRRPQPVDQTFDFGAPIPGGEGDGSKGSAAVQASGGLVSRVDVHVWSERLDDNPLAEARGTLDLWGRIRSDHVRLVVDGHAEYDSAYLIDRERFDEATLDAYETSLWLGEAYGALSLGPVEVSVGRQVLVWGEGDLLSPLDVLSPRDNRRPGLADVDDIHLPVLAVVLGLFWRTQRLEGFWIPESAFGLRSPPFGPFSGLPAVLETASAPFASSLGGADLNALFEGTQTSYDDTPANIRVEHSQIAGRWMANWGLMDLGLYAGSLLDPAGVLRPPSLATLLADPDPVIRLDHRRYTLLGASLAATRGPLLLKSDLSGNLGKAYTTVPAVADPVGQLLESETSPELKGLISARYGGIPDTVFNAELLLTYLVDEPVGLLAPATAPALAGVAEYSHPRGRIQLTVSGVVIGTEAEQGWQARAQGTYRLSDGLKASVGYATFQPGEELGPFSGLDTHDRVLFQLRWEAQLN